MVVPQAPSVLTDEVTVDTAQIEVLSKEQGTVVMEIDGVEYTSGDGAYNQAYEGYIYTLDLPQQVSKPQMITIHVVSPAGVASDSVSIMRTIHE